MIFKFYHDPPLPSPALLRAVHCVCVCVCVCVVFLLRHKVVFQFNRAWYMPRSLSSYLQMPIVLYDSLYIRVFKLPSKMPIPGSYANTEKIRKKTCTHDRILEFICIKTEREMKRTLLRNGIEVPFQANDC